MQVAEALALAVSAAATTKVEVGRSKRLNPFLPSTTNEVPTSSRRLADSEYVHHQALCVVFKLVNRYTICNMIRALHDI